MNWIKENMMHYRLTQQDVANALDVNISTVSLWESGRYSPGIYHRNALHELFIYCLTKTSKSVYIPNDNTDKSKEVVMVNVEPEMPIVGFYKLRYHHSSCNLRVPYKACELYSESELEIQQDNSPTVGICRFDWLNK